MLFNSVEFLIFLPLAFLVYWTLNSKTKAQNLFALSASYLFYGWWDWRFLGLIFISSLCDYLVGRGLESTDKGLQRKILLGLSLALNLGLLGIFKYYNFFASEFASLLDSFGFQANISSLNLILPVGISFYTFQTLSYSIDVYRKQIPTCKDHISFFAYVAYFPQLVAGPIERAGNLIPQFQNERKFNSAESIKGLKQILWGLVKKVVIADSCAGHVDYIFSNYETLPASLLLLGAVYFAFQIYGDFSGYSDIAIGTSRLFGIRLMRNFAYPYFSRDIAEFWRRWHISLSTWFRDYVYIPLGGSRLGKYGSIRNIFIIFLVSGFWHGANWTFIVWGGLNAAYFLPLFLLDLNRKNSTGIAAQGRILPGLKEGTQILFTFIVTCLAWVFFRAENLGHSFEYLNGIFDMSLFSSPGNPNLSLTPIYLLLFFIPLEWYFREHEVSLEGLKLHRVVRWMAYYVLIYLIIQFSGDQVDFIYFQF